MRAYDEHGDDFDAMCRAFRTSGVATERRMPDLFVRDEPRSPTSPVMHRPGSR